MHQRPAAENTQRRQPTRCKMKPDLKFQAEQYSSMIPFLKRIATDKRFLDAYVEAIVSNIRIAVLDKNYTIIWVNERFCRLTQYTQHELVGNPIDKLKLICLDYKSFKTIFQTISKGEEWSGEIKSQAKDDSFFWTKTTILPIKDGDEIESYLVFNSNITATKNALEEKNIAVESLTRSEARYRALVENQSDLVSLCQMDGTRIFVNKSYCRFMGKSFEALIGTRIADLPLKGVPHHMMVKVFSLTLQSPEISEVMELENAAGEKVWISLHVKGIFDAAGNLYEFLTISRDVTDLKNAELRKTHYIDALEKIAFMTSHNVRGPIATMLGLAELLRMNAIHSEKWNEVLDNFKKCISDLDTYTRELGAFIYQRQSSK